MKRRSFLSALAALLPASLVAGESSHPGGALDQWTAGASEVIQPTPWKAQCRKAMTWAITCLRRGGHWDFEGIDWFSASIGFMRNHLMRVHGHTKAEVDSMNTNEIVAVHDAHHEGRPYKQYDIPPNPPNGVNHLNHTKLRKPT